MIVGTGNIIFNNISTSRNTQIDTLILCYIIEQGFCPVYIWIQVRITAITILLYFIRRIVITP